MNLTKIEFHKILKFGTFAFLIFLITIHISLTWRLIDKDISMSRLLSISLTYWAFSLYFLYKKHHQLKLESTLYEKLLGCLILSLILYKRIFLFILGHLYLHYNLVFPLVQPFISILGLALFASGIKGLKQYWKILFLLFVLALPLRYIILKIIDLPNITATYSSCLLRLLGYTVSHQGANIFLPSVQLIVIADCSGITSIVLLLQLLILIFLAFSLNWYRKVFLFLLAINIPFLINVLRVTLMGILLVSDRYSSFLYWHDGAGSKIIYWIILLAFGLCCLFFIKEDNSQQIKVH